MNLPSCELNNDARFGFDGGRHVRFMGNVTQAEADSRDWLLCHRSLTGHRMRMRQCDLRGCIATLPDVAPGGGGSIQGLSMSAPLYNPTPVACESWMLASVPRACTSVHPLLLRAFHISRDGASHGMWHGSTDAACAAAWHIEGMRVHITMDGDSMLLDIANALSRLDTDAERLMALDIPGEASEEASTAYIDDLKMRLSSHWSLKPACRAISAGASHLGLVYECGSAGKTRISIEGVAPGALKEAPMHLCNTIQEGSPYIVTHTDPNPFLGVPDGIPPLRADGDVHRSPAAANQAVRLRILKKISSMAAIAVRVAASHAFRLWQGASTLDVLKRS